MSLLRPPTRLPGLVALLAALIVGAGCVAPVGSRQGGADAVPGTPTATADVLEGTSSVAEFEADVSGAAGLANAYWKANLKGSGFRPIRRVFAYQREGEVTCGGQPLGLRNAAYCPAGDFIAYDVRWAVGAFRQIGDAFVFYLLDHEYAHAIQVRLGIRSEFTIQQELQADCMAGAYLGDSVRSGALLLADGDLDEFRSGLLAVGDDPGQPWFAEGAHGTAEQRTASFFDGYERSLEPCGLG